MADRKTKKVKWGEVTCELHGKPMANAPWKARQVRVPLPTTRAEKYIGCPECNMAKS